jgi:hypothetical protein
LATGSFACRSSVQYEIRILLIFFVRMNEWMNESALMILQTTKACSGPRFWWTIN